MTGERLGRAGGLVLVTSYDYIMTMNEVRIAELKARLSEHLRRVRRGHVLTVLDRDTPVARLVPYQESEPLRVRDPLGRARSLQDVPLPPPLAIDVDVVELLLEERQGER
jgi:prevent-host-death family protein